MSGDLVGKVYGSLFGPRRCPQSANLTIGAKRTCPRQSPGVAKRSNYGRADRAYPGRAGHRCQYVGTDELCRGHETGRPAPFFDHRRRPRRSGQMLDRATDMPSARRSIRFFDAVCSALHFAKRMVFIGRRGLFGAVIKTAKKCSGDDETSGAAPAHR